jgi:hypothetical protein
LGCPHRSFLRTAEAATKRSEKRRTPKAKASRFSGNIVLLDRDRSRSQRTNAHHSQARRVDRTARERSSGHTGLGTPPRHGQPEMANSVRANETQEPRTDRPAEHAGGCAVQTGHRAEQWQRLRVPTYVRKRWDWPAASQPGEPPIGCQRHPAARGQPRLRDHPALRHYRQPASLARFGRSACDAIDPKPTKASPRDKWYLALASVVPPSPWP